MLSSSRLAQWMASGARRYANDGNARLWPVGLAMAMAAVGALWPETPVQSEGAVSVDAHAVGVGAGLHLARNIEWEARRRHAKAMQTHQLPIYKDVKQQYRMEAVIGQGGFGLVHSAYDTRSQDAVAIKHVDKRNTSKAKFMQEVDILREMGGKKNVVGLREAFETSDAYVLVTELVEGEELFDRLIQEGTFTEREAKPLVHKLAETLAYLHAHRVVHGDLKPENILLSEDSSMRLIDFGQSFRLNSSSSARSPRNSKCVATMAYAAPEVLRGEVAATGSGVDMWALGIVLYILLVGHHPFDPTNDATDEVLRDRILVGEIDTKAEDWQNLSESAKNIITRLLQSDPAERLTANQVLHDSWMQ